jgi:SAM-dependent methyltransferase
VVVRRVRGDVELRVEGTLASVYRPQGRTLTGVVWWALAAPVLLFPASRGRPRVLLLGLGGGSVARALRALAPAARLVGVERDREVLRLARRHLGLGSLGLEAVQGDALEFLRRERRRYDLIVEDLFVGPSRSVRKPEWLLGEGYRLIGRRLRPGGVVVSNTIHEMPAIVRAMRLVSDRVLSLDVRGHWNRIVVCGRDLPGPQVLRQTLDARPETARALQRVAIRSRGARLSGDAPGGVRGRGGSWRGAAGEEAPRGRPVP